MNFFDGFTYFMDGADGQRIANTAVVSGSYMPNRTAKAKANIIKALFQLHDLVASGAVKRKLNGGEVVVTCSPNRVVKSMTGSIVVNEQSDVALALVMALIHDLPSNPTPIDYSPSKSYTATDLQGLGYEEYYQAIVNRQNDLIEIEIDTSLSIHGDLNRFKIVHPWTREEEENINFHFDKFNHYEATDLVVEVTKWLKEKPSILLSGGTSAGKTTAIAKASTILGLPFYYQQFDKGMDIDRFLGTYVPDESGNGFKKVYSQAVQAFKNGGILLLDEVNTVSGDFTAVLHPMLDEQGIMVLPDGEKVYRHPLFKLAGGINEKYSGTKPMNVAFLRRFGRKIRVKPMDEGTMNVLAKTKYADAIASGALKEDDIKKAIECAKAIEEFYITERIREAGIGITHVYNFLDLFMLTGDAKMSAVETLVNTSCENEETNTAIETTIIATFY